VKIQHFVYPGLPSLRYVEAKRVHPGLVITPGGFRLLTVAYIASGDVKRGRPAGTRPLTTVWSALGWPVYRLITVWLPYGEGILFSIIVSLGMRHVGRYVVVARAARLANGFARTDSPSLSARGRNGVAVCMSFRQ
jgi:hypothetical protein